MPTAYADKNQYIVLLGISVISFFALFPVVCSKITTKNGTNIKPQQVGTFHCVLKQKTHKVLCAIKHNGVIVGQLVKIRLIICPS